jgi:hypothetical protein
MLKGNSSKKSRLPWSHRHHGSRFWRFPNRISRRIRSHMRNGLSLWIRALGGWLMKKNRGSKISWRFPFKAGNIIASYLEMFSTNTSIIMIYGIKTLSRNQWYPRHRLYYWTFFSASSNKQILGRGRGQMVVEGGSFKRIVSWDLGVLFTMSLDRYEVRSRAGSCLLFILWIFSYTNVKKKFVFAVKSLLTYWSWDPDFSITIPKQFRQKIPYNSPKMHIFPKKRQKFPQKYRFSL